MIVKQNLEESNSEFVKRKAYIHRIVESRLNDNNKLLAEKSANRKPITAAQRQAVDLYWKKHLHAGAEYVNLDYYDVYNKVAKEEELARYMPDSFFYAFIDEWLTNPSRSAPVDDKNLYDLLFADVLRPQTIARKVEESFFDADFNKIGVNDFIEICKKQPEVFVKAAIYSYGGHGVMCWNPKKDSVEKLLNFIYRNNSGEGHYIARTAKQYVVQAPLKQHEALSKINSSSINTVRIMSLVWGGEVHILSSVLRMGINGSRVDNCSSGGIVCGIDANGVCKSVAYDNKANAYYSHPNGTEFAGVAIPGYDKCVVLVKKLAYRFFASSRLISWDLAINENGEPVVVEMNISYGELDFHQLCNGPIFGDLTEEILDKLYEESFTFKKLLGH